MVEESRRIDASVRQDPDLLSRLNSYFESFEEHFRTGTGWVIYNAGGERGQRVVRLIAEQLGTVDVPLAYVIVPWREFALNAYMTEIELPVISVQSERLSGRARTEFDIATRVARDNMVRFVASDLLVLSGVNPRYQHETGLLEETIQRRYNLKSPTILTTPAQPHEFAERFQSVSADQDSWQHVFTLLYERALFAM